MQVNTVKADFLCNIKQNKKNTFILSKSKKGASYFASKSTQYVALSCFYDNKEHDNIDYDFVGEYKLVSFVVDDAQMFDSKVWAKAAFLCLKDEKDADNLLVIACAALDTVKCDQCHGSGNFKTSSKTSYAETQGAGSAQHGSRIMQAKASVSTHIHTCRYNHAKMTGCDGVGLDSIKMHEAKQNIAILAENKSFNAIATQMLKHARSDDKKAVKNADN